MRPLFLCSLAVLGLWSVLAHAEPEAIKSPSAHVDYRVTLDTRDGNYRLLDETGVVMVGIPKSLEGSVPCSKIPGVCAPSVQELAWKAEILATREPPSAGHVVVRMLLSERSSAGERVSSASIHGVWGDVLADSSLLETLLLRAATRIP